MHLQMKICTCNWHSHKLLLLLIKWMDNDLNLTFYIFEISAFYLTPQQENKKVKFRLLSIHLMSTIEV